MCLGYFHLLVLYLFLALSLSHAVVTSQPRGGESRAGKCAQTREDSNSQPQGGGLDEGDRANPL